MSFLNPLSLNGKQLENFNKTQIALQNITNSYQKQEVIKKKSQKQVSFDDQKTIKQIMKPSSEQASLHNNYQQKQKEQYFDVDRQKFKNGYLKQNENENDKIRVDKLRNENMRFKSTINKKEENINDLFEQSGETLKQIQQQFQNLKIENNLKNNKQMTCKNQKDNDLQFQSRSMLKLNNDGSNLQSLISDVDKIIKQAKLQTKQLTSNEFEIQKKQNNNYNYRDSYRKDKFGSNKELSLSPRQKKINKKRDKSQDKTIKNKRKSYKFEDDTSSNSNEQKNIIQEQDQEETIQLNQSNHSEDFENQQILNQRSKLKSRKKFSNNPIKQRNTKINDSDNSKNLSIISKPHSNTSKNNKQIQNNDLSDFNLKSISGTPKVKDDLSVYSNTSKNKLSQSQISHQNSITGFRRCHEESEEDIKHKNEINTDDSFNINDDFNILESKMLRQESSHREQAQNKQGYLIKNQLNNKNSNYEVERGNDNLVNQHINKQIKNYNQNNQKNQVNNIQNITQKLKQFQNQMQIQTEENNLVFCINCEEYIDIDKVDEHSNNCQSSKIDKQMDLKQIIGKINEKLIKIRNLIKSKHQKYINKPLNNNQIQDISNIYQQILENISICIESNKDIKILQKAENDIKYINIQLTNDYKNNSHYLLYFTQKVIEFVQRKYEFISCYGNDQQHKDIDNLKEEDNMNCNFQNKNNLGKRDISSFQNKIDSISIASSNFTNLNSFKGNMNVQIQNNQKKKNPIKIFSKMEENLNFYSPNQNIQNQSKDQILPQRQPLQTNNRNNIFKNENKLHNQTIMQQNSYNQTQNMIDFNKLQSPKANSSLDIFKSPNRINYQTKYNEEQENLNSGFNQKPCRNQNQIRNQISKKPLSIDLGAYDQKNNSNCSGAINQKYQFENTNRNYFNQQSFFSPQSIPTNSFNRKL